MFIITNYKLHIMQFLHFFASLFISFPKHSDRHWVPHMRVDHGLKRMGHEADHSEPSGDRFKNIWNYTSSPSARLHGPHQDNFTFSPYAHISSQRRFLQSQQPYNACV